MTKKDIIEELYRNGHLRSECEKMAVGNKAHAEDLLHELVIILMEYDDAKIEDLYERDELKYFVYKIIRNQWCNTSSVFYSKYLKFKNLTISINEKIQ